MAEVVLFFFFSTILAARKKVKKKNQTLCFLPQNQSVAVFMTLYVKACQKMA